MLVGGPSVARKSGLPFYLFGPGNPAIKLTPGGKKDEEVLTFAQTCHFFLLSNVLRRVHHIRCVDRVYFILLKNSFFSDLTICL